MKSATTLLFLVIWLVPCVKADVKVTRLTPTVLEYEVYSSTGHTSVALDDLELWRSIPKQANPVGWWWSSEPDFKYYLVSEGLAKLRDRNAASQLLRDAEDAAKAADKGMWHV